jgi:hypothetical protein
VDSPLQNIVNHGLLDRKVFTLKLPRTDEEFGELVLGDVDASYAQSSITLPLTKVEGGHYTPFSFLASAGWQVNVSTSGD